MPIFGPNEQQLKENSKKDYEKAVALKGDSRKEDAYRMRIGLRVRGHIDKLFVEAAQKAEKFNGNAAMLGMFALLGAYYFTDQILPGIL